MTVATFANDTLTIRKTGVAFSFDLSELDAEDLRDQLLERYPVEPEATPAVELPEEPTVAGWYVTATSDQMLYNDGDACENWSRLKVTRWSNGNIYEDWSTVVRDLGPERLPLKFIRRRFQ